MAINYLVSGDSLSADKLNLIFAELDRKLKIRLCGKSHLFGGALPGFKGKVFQFYEGNAQLVDFDLGAYNHSDFEDIANGATLVSKDEENKIALVSPQTPSETLDGSLQAHTRLIDGETYWLKPEAQARSERVHKLRVAEIVVENKTSITIQKEWNKYNFFRVHNFGRTPIRAIFEGETIRHEYEIEAFGCIAVRRTTIDSGYSAPYKYLFEARSGDGRFYHMGGDAEANNVANFVGLLQWLSLFEFDPAVLHNVTGYESIFGDGQNQWTKLRELMTQKGRFFLVNRTDDQITELTFEKHEDLAGQLQQFGITVEEDEKGGFTLSPPVDKDFDIVTTGTNFLKSGWNISPFQALPASTESEFETEGAELLTVTDTNQEVLELQPDNKGFLVDPQRVYYQRKLFVKNGHPNLSANGLVKNLKDQYSTSDDAFFSIGPNGFQAPINREHDFRFPHGLKEGETLAGRFSRQSKTLKTAEVLRFKYDGWPSNDYIPGFANRPIYARASRRYDSIEREEEARMSLDVSNGYSSKSIVALGEGKDFEFSKMPATERSEIQIQQILSKGETAEQIKNQSNPDHVLQLPPDQLDQFLKHYSEPGWYEANRETLFGSQTKQNPDGTIGPVGPPRQLMTPLLVETYNHIAWLINSVTWAKPLQLWDIYEELSPSRTFDFYPETFGSPVKPTESGARDDFGNQTWIRPAAQFMRITPYDEIWDRANDLGIPIKTKNDFPDSFHNARSQSGRITEWKIGPGHTVSENRKHDNAAFDSYDFQIYGNLYEHYWIDIADIKRVSELFGIEFSFASQGEIYELRTFNQEGNISLIESWQEVTRDSYFDTANKWTRFVPASNTFYGEWIRSIDRFDVEPRSIPVEKLIKNVEVDDFDFIRQLEADWKIQKPDAVRQVDEQNAINWGYFSHTSSSVKVSTWAFVSDLAFFKRQANANTSKTNRDNVVRHGSPYGKPLEAVEQNLDESKSVSIFGSAMVVSANPGRWGEVYVVDRREIEIDA